jgi:hypothetical protein
MDVGARKSTIAPIISSTIYSATSTKLLPTNLLDMKKDPYLEDRQLAAPREIVDLVNRFESNLESHKSGHYNETWVRIVNIYPQKLLRD